MKMEDSTERGHILTTALLLFRENLKDHLFFAKYVIWATVDFFSGISLVDCRELPVKRPNQVLRGGHAPHHDPLHLHLLRWVLKEEGEEVVQDHISSLQHVAHC